MGVLGLWQLLAPVGQPVALESLENKVFAVDISIWLNQAVKGYRDSKGGSVTNAHLLSLYSRLCKLLFYKIKPIMVFDGGFPELKKQTIINRQRRRDAMKQSSRDIGLKILSNYLASQNIKNSEGSASGKFVIRPKENVRDEIYVLPPLPENSYVHLEETNNMDLIDWKFTNFSKEDIKYLNTIDIESEDFSNLPPDVKQEILSTLKESRKHRTWDQYQELPEDSNEFSTYQMQCLLKKRNLTRKLEEVRKDLRQMSSSDFISQYTNDHVIGETNKIMSDDYSHYVLLKKIVENKKETEKNSDVNISFPTSTMIDTKYSFIKDMENIDIDCNNSLLHENNDFQVKEEENVDDPPMVINELNSNISTKPIKNLNTQPSDLHLSSDDDADLALTVQMSMESINDNLKSDIHLEETHNTPEKSSVSENDDQFSDKESVKLQFSEKCINEIREEITVSSDEEMVPCDELSVSNEDKAICSTKVVTTGSNELSFPNSNYEMHSEHVKVNLNKEISIENVEISAKEDQEIKIWENCDDNQPSTSISRENNYDVLPGTSISHENNDDVLPSTSISHENFKSPEQEVEEYQRNLKLQNELESTTLLLEADQAKQDRQARTVQEHMVEECKELLQLFGVPFVISPTEAEAQCAFYDALNLTHGTITDDSDVWLFGGKRVYKNFFAQQKYVEFYKDQEIFNHFGLSREKLIIFAMLTGSDYTEGIEGVGPVTAMEILSEFPGDSINALHEFKTWWHTANQHACPPENKVRAKLLKLILSENFPDEKILEAYLNPTIDSSTEKFTWGRPDLDALRDYTKERFGWTKSKVDDTLLPVIKKVSERSAQTHLDSFFTVNLKKHAELFPSKRIMTALKKMTSPQKVQELENNSKKTTKRKARNIGKAVKSKKVVKRNASDSVKQSARKLPLNGPVLSEESSDDS